MENLRSYGNDSDSLEESEDDKIDEVTSEGLIFSNEPQPHVSVKTQPHLLVKRPCIEQAAQIIDISETAEKSQVFVNYLGLEVAGRSSSYAFSHSQTQNDQKSRKMQTSCGEVEIPNSDFWRDFEPDHNSMAPIQGVDTSGYYQKHTEKVDVHKGSFTEIPTFKNSARRLHCDNNFGKAESYGSVSKQIKLSDQNDSEGHPCDHIHLRQKELSSSLINKRSQQIQHAGFLGNSVESNQTLTNEKRKVYYIHSKVAPYVNITPVNKCAGKLQHSWPAHDGVVNRLSWNVPNFSHLLVTAGMDTFVRVWNVWSSLDRCVVNLSSHKKAVKHVEWCQTGRKVLSCSYDRTAQVTDVETAKSLGNYEHMGFVTAGCMHSSNPNLFVTGTESMVLKWDMRTPQAPVRYFSHKDKFGQVQDLLFITNGQEFVSCSDLVSRDCADRSVMVWDLRAGTVLSNQIFQERYMCTRLKLHPSKSVFMAQTHAGYVALFSTTSPYKMDKSKRYEGHKVQGHSIGFDISPDGTLVYSGSAGEGIHCYHQHSGRLMRKLPSRKDIVTDVACHPALPSVLASCSWGGSVSLWM